ncbi:MAG: sigma factor-like helix-turn-helix DNA-binding protein [Planctomycetota bacterium]|jgi:transcriptional regulator
MPAAKLTHEVLDLVCRLNAAGWTDDQIADVVGVTQPNVCLARKRLGARAVYRGRTKERCRRARQERFEESFERLNGHEIIDPRTPLRRLIAKEEVERFLGNRDARTRRILGLRGRGWTLSHIGQVFGLTRERVRQVIGEAVRVGADHRPSREGRSS